jgi:hypothetical protein
VCLYLYHVVRGSFPVLLCWVCVVYCYFSFEIFSFIAVRVYLPACQKLGWGGCFLIICKANSSDLNTPLTAPRVLRLPKCLDNRHMIMVNVVSPTHRPPLPGSRIFWYSFLLESEPTPTYILRLEGVCQWKFKVTSYGTETVTFRLEAQCLQSTASPRGLIWLKCWSLKFYFPLLFWVISLFLFRFQSNVI